MEDSVTIDLENSVDSFAQRILLPVVMLCTNVCSCKPTHKRALTHTRSVACTSVALSLSAIWLAGTVHRLTARPAVSKFLVHWHIGRHADQCALSLSKKERAKPLACSANSYTGSQGRFCIGRPKLHLSGKSACTGESIKDVK